jgi:hypothetical protein
MWQDAPVGAGMTIVPRDFFAYFVLFTFWFLGGARVAPPICFFVWINPSQSPDLFELV